MWFFYYFQGIQSDGWPQSVWCDLFEQMNIGHRVLDVAAKVFDLLALVGRLGEMIVDPSEQQLFLGKLEQVLLGLAISEQQHQAGMMRQIDLGKQTNLNDLPEEAEDQMLLAVLDVVRPDVDHVTPDRLGTPQCQFQILKLLIDGQTFAFVDWPLVDRVRHRKIDQFTWVLICGN